METSNKSKNRKPIFDRKKEENIQQTMYGSSPQFYREAPKPQASHLSSHSGIIYSPRPTPVLRPHSAAKPVTINIIPPFKHPQQQQFHAPGATEGLTRSMSPIVRQSYPVQRQPSPQIVTRPVSQTQNPVFHNTAPFQMMNSQPSNLRKSGMHPSVVSVERIMKPIGQNEFSREVPFTKPNIQAFTRPQGHPQVQNVHILQPQALKQYQPVHRKVSSLAQAQEVSNMNDLLASNYDELYDELQDLKGELVTKDIVEEQSFLKKTSLQIENIFNIETFEALSKIQNIGRHREGQTVGNQSNLSLTRSFYR